MKASSYHQYWDDDPVLQKIAEYIEDYPVRSEKLADLRWITDDADEDFALHMEEAMALEFSDEALDAMFSGQLKVGHFLCLCEKMFEKSARRSTPSERVKQRQYYRQNKHKIKRKAKMRRMKERTGAHRRRKRMGTAESGYQFVLTGDSGPSAKQSGPSYAKPRKAPSAGDFNPEKNTGSTERQTKLKPL